MREGFTTGACAAAAAGWDAWHGEAASGHESMRWEEETEPEAAGAGAVPPPDASWLEECVRCRVTAWALSEDSGGLGRHVWHHQLQ